MSFFNENDVNNIWQKIDNECSDRSKEKLTREQNAKAFAYTMMNTFMLFKEAAREYPHICIALGIRPEVVELQNAFYNTTNEFYCLECETSMYFSESYEFGLLGVNKDGVLVFKRNKRNSYGQYIVEHFNESHLRNIFESYYISNLQSGRELGKLKMSRIDERYPLLFDILALFSFYGSESLKTKDNYDEHIIVCYSKVSKSEKEIRESVKKYFLELAERVARRFR